LKTNVAWTTEKTKIRRKEKEMIKIQILQPKRNMCCQSKFCGYRKHLQIQITTHCPRGKTMQKVGRYKYLFFSSISLKNMVVFFLFAHGTINTVFFFSF
jgi:hypothetical protein